MPDVPLFSPLRVGPLELPNRVAMAPMTRLRAFGGVPNSLMAEYYAQRATAGLIVTECTMVEPRANGYVHCPGVFSTDQVAGWRGVTEAVHASGGNIFLQLWHCGRVSHPSLQPGGADPVAPSAIAGIGDLHTTVGKVDLAVPRALDAGEIPAIVDHFRAAAANAREAGFDGVEIHGAFGYLIDQFLQGVSNRRADGYGGSVANRCRFCLEVADAVVGVWGPDRVGVKLSPANTFYGMLDSDPLGLFGHLLGELDQRPLAYVHLMEPSDGDRGRPGVIEDVLGTFRSFYRGRVMSNGGHTRASAERVLESGEAALVSFGRSYLANPDLVERLRRGTPLAAPDFSTLYARSPEGAERGYTDYPTLTAGA